MSTPPGAPTDPAAGANAGPLAGPIAGLSRLAHVERGELGALLWSFAYFFCVLAAYYVIRPVREEWP
jgi:AAA family ATP:ADP antiporter